MENQGRPELPGFNTFPGLLLALTALSGELPTSLVSRLPAAGSYKEYAIKHLKRDKLLRTFYRDGLRCLRLTSTAKRLLTEEWPDEFSPFLTGDTETNRLKSEVTRRLRLHRMAEVLVTVYNADVSVLPWEKPPLFAPVPPSGLTVMDRPTYFSSREVKGLGGQTVKIRGSRSTGVLLTADDIFAVYNTGSGLMKWECRAEMRLKALLETELCLSRLSAQYSRTGLSAIVFAADMGLMAGLMGADGGRTNCRFVLDGSFEHFFCLPLDHHGEVVLRLLCDPGKRADLDSILKQGLDPPRPGWGGENDAMDGDQPVLFAYTCDMPRIYRFNTALELTGRNGALYCFDFQEDVLRRVCGPNVSVSCIDFEAYERSVFLSPGKK